MGMCDNMSKEQKKAPKICGDCGKESNSLTRNKCSMCYSRWWRVENPERAKERDRIHHEKRYKEDPERYKTKGKKRYDETMNRLNAIKSSMPCMDCQQFFPPECMDFDHRDGAEKVDCVSLLLNRSWDVVLAEINKCDLVCSNCHRIRTKRRRDQKLWLQ